MDTDKDAAILMVAKDLLLFLASRQSDFINASGGAAAIDDLGQKFARLAKKISQELQETKRDLSTEHNAGRHG